MAASSACRQKYSQHFAFFFFRWDLEGAPVSRRCLAGRWGTPLPAEGGGRRHVHVLPETQKQSNAPKQRVGGVGRWPFSHRAKSLKSDRRGSDWGDLGSETGGPGSGTPLRPAHLWRQLTRSLCCRFHFCLCASCSTWRVLEKI